MAWLASSFASNRVEAAETNPYLSPQLGNCFGGAVYSSGPCAFTNSTWFQNVAAAQVMAMPPGFDKPEGLAGGAALYQASNLVTLVHSTIASNIVAATKMTGSALHVESAASANLVASILSGNIQFNYGGPGALVDGGHNLSSDASGSVSAATSRTNADAMLGPFETINLIPVLPLRAGSPAIDSVPASGCPIVDQRGMPRPIGVLCDAGAFEYQPPPVIELRSDGTVHLEWILSPDQGYQIDSSTNLKAWALLSQLVLADHAGRVSLNDTSSAGAALNFYRVVTPPRMAQAPLTREKR